MSREYEVTFYGMASVSATVYVEADSEEEAKAKALDEHLGSRCIFKDIDYIDWDDIEVEVY